MAATATAADAAPTHTAFGQTRTVDELRPSPLNPRKHFDPAAMAELQANIAKHGVIVPLIARTQKDHLEILDGERRWRAAQAAGVATVPVTYREMSDSDAIEFMLLNSIQRQDLTPLEEAAGFKALITSNKAKYSALYIADRIGRTERYVWDRMKLLDLIPVLKKLLDHERILVGHAELLAKLKPEDQERAVEWDGQNLAYRKLEGLWETEYNRLKLDEDEDDEAPGPKNLYRGLKPVTVKELESWVAHHVRFDVEHMAKAAPLEFAETAEKVAIAEALPGKRKKVISITDEYRVADDARDDGERTYGESSWRKADGKDGDKGCEHSVIGVFVTGRRQGRTLEVCINRDKCTTHFGKEIKEREKNQKLRQQGKGGQAAQNEAVSESKRREKEQQEQRERAQLEKAWSAISKALLAECVAQVKGSKALAPKQEKFFEDQYEVLINVDLAKKHGIKPWGKNLAAALLVSEIDHQIEGADDFDHFSRFAARFGLDIKRLEAIRDKHAPKTETPAPAKPAKKAKKR